jgi:DNA polymerase-1
MGIIAKPADLKACQLIHDGALALSQVEANGMRIDVEYLDRTIEKSKTRLKEMESRLRSHEIYDLWRRRFGSRAKLGSRSQLADVLVSDLGYTIQKTEATQDEEFDFNYKADTNELTPIAKREPFVLNYLKWQSLSKAVGTFLEGIRSQTTEAGFLHPFFNLHTARTYRSSSSDPNFQNFPIRDKKLAKLIRQCFIAREGHQIVEMDFGGIEVCIAACYHKDPTMIKYIKDPTKDMHRDMAAQCYLCKPEDVSKLMRYSAKNMFVFPQFYGSYFAQCAPHLWQAIADFDLEVGCVPVYGWLEDKGIRELGETVSNHETGRIETKPGTFMEHIRQVEDDFWKNRFPVYAKWKREWHDLYQKTGGFLTLTGFRVEGVMKRNNVINYPVQGSAFHCLLWTLIQVQKWLRKRKMRTRIVGQIHDSIVADVHESEREEYIAKVWEVATADLPRHWDWINVPMKIEAEAAPPGGSWFDKKEIDLSTII